MFFAMTFSFVIVGDEVLGLRNTIRVGALVLMAVLAV